MNNFFEKLSKDAGMGIINLEKIKIALQNGAVETLFLSEKLDKIKARELKKLAENIGSNLEMISIETEEGEQFYNLGGIGAILRYKV